jgi:hypothetical protein
MGRALVARERGLAAESATRLGALSEEFALAGMDEDRDEASIQVVRSRIAAGDAEGAAAVGGALLERASRSEVRRLRHLARLASGELDAARGSLDRAASTFVEEERASRAAGQVLYALEARAGLALVERRRGSAGAERIAAAALAEAERLGAGRIAARLRAAR